MKSDSLPAELLNHLDFSAEQAQLFVFRHSEGIGCQTVELACDGRFHDSLSDLLLQGAEQLMPLLQK